MSVKILLLRFSSIGDIVLTTPVARCLKKQLGAEVHFLTKRAFAPMLLANPHIDRVFSFEKEVTEVLSDLKSERYDWLVDLHHNLRSLHVKLALGRPARSFDKLNVEKWLMVYFKTDRLPDLHIVTRYMATVAHLGVHYDGDGLDYFIPPDEEVQVSDFSDMLTEGNYIAFVLGATHATKRLPVEKAAEICRHLDQPVVLLGGRTEQAAAQAIVGPNVVNLCGQLSLHQSASFVRQAGKVLTHDTGLMHIAAAFRKKIVSVWGNTIPKFGMYPFYPTGMQRNTSIEVKGLPCRPCSKIGFDRCPKGHFKCMNDISPAEVVEALKK
ncbi:MAG: glycosyltransferase family 9 protein [Haliscomenobacteraceae bacterium CHB4]|nr:glycosyltransferase family 9 protein [Haliscomenobacteraceae bacterium CHB4]